MIRQRRLLAPRGCEDAADRVWECWAESQLGRLCEPWGLGLVLSREQAWGSVPEGSVSRDSAWQSRAQ